MKKRVSAIINGQEFAIETGKVARQASGSVWVTCGETVVLVTAVGDQSVREGIDFLPLTVDYQEMFFASGRIPGNFFRREVGRPSERETLTSRLIDRPIRSLIPKGWTHETQIIATVYSVDKVHDPDVMALTGASAALSISDVPFAGPIAGVRVGRVDGELIINPTSDQREKSDLDFIVAGSKDAVVMVEGGAQLVSEDDALEAIWFGHAELQKLIEIQEQLVAEVGKEKRGYTPPQKDEELLAKVREMSQAGIKEILSTAPKLERYGKVRELKAKVIADMGEEAIGREKEIKEMVEELEAQGMRAMILDTGTRVDGRPTDKVRPIECEVGILPRTHGSALFTRGETQALVTATLGTSGDEQRIESVIEGDTFRRFLLHYNFPPYSVGEVKRLGGPSRRDIGHGGLSTRALEKVLPDKEVFDYTIRLVSEVLESNGSSSMGTVCAGTLALMDGGVPVKAPVAGIAMGLVKGEERVVVLTDILGDEDHTGDMDFKVAGTAEGITALQMDIKIHGLSREILQQALAQAREGRLHILERMLQAIEVPRNSISPYAPCITTIDINPDKIRDVIGPGGKVIRALQNETNTKIDLDDSGTVKIAAASEEDGRAAIERIRALTMEPEVGRIYEGKVVKIMDFGAFVQILPGTDGLVHISQLANQRVTKVSDVVREGDSLRVKVLEITRDGKIRLSHKALLEEAGDGRKR